MKPPKSDLKPLRTPPAPVERARARPLPLEIEEEAEFEDMMAGIDTTTPVPEARPNPVELPAPINPEGGRKQSVELHRNLFCTYYDGCLDEAVKKGWNSFTCLRCTYYHDNREPDEGVERYATQRRLS